MKEPLQQKAGNSTPATPTEIQMVFNRNSPFEIVSHFAYSFKVIDEENNPCSTSYHWQVANGTILEGQGSALVKIKFGEIHGATISVMACNREGKKSEPIQQYLKVHKK